MVSFIYRNSVAATLIHKVNNNNKRGWRMRRCPQQNGAIVHFTVCDRPPRRRNRSTVGYNTPSQMGKTTPFS